MGDALKLIGFILVAIGFVGLILADFVFDWGIVGISTFAALNAAGFVIPVFTSQVYLYHSSLS
jgi:hypothetical protein